MRKLIVEYNPKWTAINDSDALVYGEKLAESTRKYESINKAIVSNEIAILSIRVAIKTGLFSHVHVVFEFNGEEIECLEDGSIHYWPIGFCDNFDILFEKLFDI